MTASLLGVFLLSTAIGHSGPSDADVRKAVERSLPYIEKEGNAWITERKCLSCHFVSFMTWSHNEAKTAGVNVDAKKLADMNNWALDYSLGARQWYRLSGESVKRLKADGVDEAIFSKLKPIMNENFVTETQFTDKVAKLLSDDELKAHRNQLVKHGSVPATAEKNDGGSIATMGQLLVGRSRDKSDKLDSFLASAPLVMRKWQQGTGAWQGVGQMPKQNRPREEGDRVTTGWGLLGLASLGPADADTQKSIKAGLGYFKKAKPGKSHEDLIVRMLVEDKFGTPEQTVKLVQEVLKAQNADGGWGWLAGASSDAFGTGMSLYALAVVGDKSAEPALSKARKYLLDTQNKEGYWEVHPKAVTDPKSNDTRIERLIPIYNFWGTAWAAIGLSRSNPIARD